MKWYPSILKVEKADELKALSKVFIFCFEFRLRRTIKSDASLGGLRKIECSSIKIKSKERHKITLGTLRYNSWTFCSQKSQLQLELPTVGSPGALGLSHLARLSIESPNRSRKSQLLEILAAAGSFDNNQASLVDCVVNSFLQLSRKFQRSVSELPTQI